MAKDQIKQDIMEDIKNCNMHEDLQVKILERFQKAQKLIVRTLANTENSTRYLELKEGQRVLDLVLEELHQYFENFKLQENLKQPSTISNAEILTKLKQTLETLQSSKLENISFEVRMSQDFHEYCKDKEVDFGEINVFLNPCQPEPYIIIKREQI